LLLFIGSDAFNKLKSWYQWQHLFDFAHIVVLTRPGFSVRQLNQFFASRQAVHKHELAGPESGKLYFQPITQLDISATAIRQLFEGHRDPRFLLPDAVIAYIYQHKIYQSAKAH
jgi:nicotinate-nucleotide adenylyltransferase